MLLGFGPGKTIKSEIASQRRRPESFLGGICSFLPGTTVYQGVFDPCEAKLFGLLTKGRD